MNPKKTSLFLNIPTTSTIIIIALGTFLAGGYNDSRAPYTSIRVFRVRKGGAPLAGWAPPAQWARVQATGVVIAWGTRAFCHDVSQLKKKKY